MTDLYVGIAIQMILMAVSFGLAWFLTRRASTKVCDLFAAFTVVGIAVYARWLWEATFMAKLFPFSNLIILSNWFPLAAGFLAGLVWQRIRDTSEHIPLLPALGKFRGSPRRILSTFLLGGAGFLTLVAPLLGTPPECFEDWSGDLCLQTSEATCSNAAASTLLQYYGVYASEGEMAELSLTRRGTNWKGLFRGLTLQGRKFGHRVEVLELTVDELVKQFTEPCILQCELKADHETSDGEYELKGWIPGQPHSTVLLEVKDDRFVIFDPSVGIEAWNRHDLETLWHGQILRLVPETPSAAAGDL